MKDKISLELLFWQQVHVWEKDNTSGQKFMLETPSLKDSQSLQAIEHCSADQCMISPLNLGTIIHSRCLSKTG